MLNQPYWNKSIMEEEQIIILRPEYNTGTESFCNCVEMKIFKGKSSERNWQQD